MPFGSHETMEAHEVLNQTLNMLNHFALYAEMSGSEEVRAMVRRHTDAAVQFYNRLLAYTHDYSAANGPGAGYATPNVEPQQIQYGLRRPQPQMPQMQGRFTDKEIAAAMLNCHKNSAKNLMAAALECADPNVREMLTQGAMNCANQAYEVFLYMNKQGDYQVPTMNDHTAKTLLHSYQPVTATSATMQPPYGQTMNPQSSVPSQQSFAGQTVPTGTAGASRSFGQTPLSGQTTFSGQMSMSGQSPLSGQPHVSPNGSGHRSPLQ